MRKKVLFLFTIITFLEKTSPRWTSSSSCDCEKPNLSEKIFGISPQNFHWRSLDFTEELDDHCSRSVVISSHYSLNFGDSIEAEQLDGYVEVGDFFMHEHDDE